MTVLVFLDPSRPAGRLADASAAQLLVTDQGVIRGDGVFESMLYTAGAVRKLDAHLSRLRGSAASCDLDLPGEQSWRAAIATAVARYDQERTADPEDPDEAVVKLVATRGPEDQPHGTAWVTVSPAPESGRRQRTEGVAVVLLDRGYDSSLAERAPWLLQGAKTLSYAVNMAALRHAHTLGAEDVIFTSSDGRVLEGPTSTVLLATRVNGVKQLVTPMVETGILPGTTQGAIFAAAEAAGWTLGYGPLEPADLFDADAVWLVSSLRLLAPVTSIDGTPISRDRALGTELAALLEAVG
ncbi:MAG: aminodeoxychorismate lyase [Arthrobacter sp.]|uniref:aminodeoxychorismate lyase n=1 Tax=unclassified Arthrobacter TaxID=235627 RepID=UPI002651396C|nr:aminodeoxychorismate lyase [Micrococcaceae bacterium]MDN5887217.1 aminodeoxychorismate lyase [Micrococcaceae bacterium]MDN5905473.1 aminodeoxychorismate lyase [Micrococcaceae bacterium]MDN6300614.1 aminodeoxychorismate lyase [Micrococcaceae bacterium]